MGEDRAPNMGGVDIKSDAEVQLNSADKAAQLRAKALRARDAREENGAEPHSDQAAARDEA